MITADLGLVSYTDRYLMGRDVSADYAATLRARVAAFCTWCGADLRVGELTCELANEWLGELSAGGMNPRTLSGYRAALLAVWREAYYSGDSQNPPLRLRKIKKPALVVTAYTHAEIATLLEFAGTLAGKHRDGNQRADFWRAAIHAGYSLGARRGDLLDLQRSQIAADGTIYFVQHKTGYVAGGRLSAEALQFIARLAGERALPWPYQRTTFSRGFKRLRKAAGVSRGTFRWIRRAAGSYAERDRPGDGARLLGHQGGAVFKAFYEDRRITMVAAPAPPALP